MSDNKMASFGSEIEIDNVLYVSVDFLLQYPDYLDNEFDTDAVASADSANDGPEEGDPAPSTCKSELVINGVTYVALPILKSNPNYIELKYKMKQDVTLPTFVPKAALSEARPAASMRRRRSAAGGDWGDR